LRSISSSTSDPRALDIRNAQFAKLVVIDEKETGMRKHSIGFVFSMITMAACGTGVETDPSSTGGTGGSDPGNSDPGGSDSDGGVLHGGSGACPQPDGPRHDYSTVAEATALIMGIWIQCSGPTPTPFQGSIGLDINADGNYYQLVSDGRGGMIRRTGLSSQGTWDLKTIVGEPVPTVMLSFWMTPSDVMGDTPLFEDNPRRFAFDQTHSSNWAIYQLVGQ
jgi:hypothetical protein